MKYLTQENIIMNEEEYESFDSAVNNSYDEEDDYDCNECGMSCAYKVNDRNFGLLYLCIRCAMINDPDNDQLRMRMHIDPENML